MVLYPVWGSVDTAWWFADNSINTESSWCWELRRTLELMRISSSPSTSGELKMFISRISLTARSNSKPGVHEDLHYDRCGLLISLWMTHRKTAETETRTREPWKQVAEWKEADTLGCIVHGCVSRNCPEYPRRWRGDHGFLTGKEGAWPQRCRSHLLLGQGKWERIAKGCLPVVFSWDGTNFPKLWWLLYKSVYSWFYTL